MQTRKSKTYFTLAFQASGQEFIEVEFPKKTRDILGSCHVSFNDEKLVVKIGGYKAKYGQKAEKITEIMKFSGKYMRFTTFPNLVVISQLILKNPLVAIYKTISNFTSVHPFVHLSHFMISNSCSCITKFD